MPTSAPGSRREAVPGRSEGFTLVELMIVVTIIGLVSAVAVLTIPERSADAGAEAERFAARVRAVQERALTGGRATAVRVTGAGYGFDRRVRGAWEPIREQPFEDRAWSEGLRAQVGGEGAMRVAFDTVGMAEPARVVIAGDDAQATVEIGADGGVRVAR